jgi:hypothetical protein
LAITHRQPKAGKSILFHPKSFGWDGRTDKSSSKKVVVIKKKSSLETVATFSSPTENTMQQSSSFQLG